jgi:hypothetical protein
MNERIRKIESRAWEQVNRTNGLVRTEDFNQKFAELIVKECIDIVEHSRIEGDEGVCLVGATKCKIQQHFGVEK